MKLFKRLRLKLGLYNRAELIKFAFEMLNKKRDATYIEAEIWHSDIENFIHDLKTQ